MFLFNTSANSSPVHAEKSNTKSFYQKVQTIFRLGTDSMLSARSGTASEDSFVTPVSSSGDLMALSPNKPDMSTDTHDLTNDLLTGAEFDSICDVTMQEVPPVYDDTMFIDASSLDYLIKCASGKNNTLVDRGKESLFVKFDPLYSRNDQGSCTESVSDATECDIGYETGSTMSVPDTHNGSPKQTLSGTSLKEKPTQVVPPVVNGSQKHHPSQTRSTPALMRSVSAILTPTQVATERLISISGNTPPTAAPRSPRYNSAAQSDRLQSLRIILQKQDQEIVHLTTENRELKSSLHDIEQKYCQTIEDLEAKVKKLTDERDNLLTRENKLVQQVNDKIMNNKQMSIVMEEYEKTISSLISEQQQERISSQETQEKLTSERDQALEHLASMESSFNDLLAKYEKCKTVILENKDREKSWMQKISEFEAGMEKYESLYNELKKVTSENLSKSNETLETITKSHNVEVMKLNATIKKHEIQIASLQESLTQKIRDNEELTRICDQLINEVR